MARRGLQAARPTIGRSREARLWLDRPHLFTSVSLTTEMTALGYIHLGESIYVSECYSTECLGHSLHVILFRANSETYLRVFTASSSRPA
jgi:hypothetical protein